MKKNDPPPVREHSSNTLDDPSVLKRYTEQLKANAPLRSFEGAVKSLEALCLQHAPERFTTPEPPERFDPERITTPERFSDGWYADEILLAIRAARSLLKEGQPNHAAAEALLAGSLAGNWPAAQRWREQQEARRRGGLAAKHLPGLQAEVNRLAAENPNATARELWNLLPEGGDDDEPIDGFIVYRDGPKVVQVEHKTAGVKAISFRSFCRYVTRARSK
jgi:hypothetical protein